MAEEITVGDLATAEEKPEAWNVMWVADLPVPGQLVEIDGEKLRDVTHKKSKGSSRDILIDQGLEPKECAFTIRTANGAQFRALYDFYLKYLDPERPLTRLNIVPVAHPTLYSRGIKMGYFFAAPLPKPTQWTGIRPYLHVFKFKIVGPKTQISANSGSSKPKQQAKVPGAVGSGPQFQVPSLAEIAAVGFFSPAPFLLPGVAAGITGFKPAPPTPPPPQAVYGPPSPADIKKAANALDVTARFTMDLLNSRAP